MKKDRNLYFKEYRKKNKEKLLEVQKRYRKNNRDKVNANARRYRKSNGKDKVRNNQDRFREKRIEQYQKYMLDKKCERCGFDDKRVLSWHHKDPKTKTNCVSNLVPGGYSWKTILTEIEKCECLCLNCHGIEHYLKNTKDKTRQQYKEFMKKQKCNRCQCYIPGTLSWHHIDPSIKKDTISSMVKNRKPWEEVLKEIAKCECLCHRCHHIETHY